MNDPLPQVRITSKPNESSLSAKITQLDGSPLAGHYGKADIHIDWQNGEPVTVDLVVVGGLSTDVVAGILSIEIDGKKYRLVEVDPQ